MNRPSFLMCPPVPGAGEKAVRQWNDFYHLLKDVLHCRIELMTPMKGLPDMVFTAHGGLVKKGLFVRSNFRSEERSREEIHFEKWFRKEGYKIKTIEKPYHFEGEADFLFWGRVLYAGFRSRRDFEAHDKLQDILKTDTVGLEIEDKKFCHLDSCFAPLSDQTALIFLPAFEPYTQLVLLESVPDPIEVPSVEALLGACHIVVVGSDAVIPEGCPQTAREMEKRGWTIHALDFSEFMKAGGAAKRLVLKLAR